MATRVLLTGGSGLLGRHLAAHWNPEWGDLELTGPSHDGIDLLEPGGFRKALDRHRPDRVVHLAWSASGQADYRTSGQNTRWLDASVEMVSACRVEGIWLALTGTPLDDSSDREADLYTTTKSELRAICADEIKAGDLTWFRPFYVFDPELGRPRLLREALAARESGQSMRLESGTRAHDFVHAGDVGAGLAVAIWAGARGLVEIGSGQLRTVASLVDALGVDTLMSSSPAKHDPHDSSAADTAVLRQMGWRPHLTEEFFRA